MPETSRPVPSRPADTRPIQRPGGTPPPSSPSGPTIPRPGRRLRVARHLADTATVLAVLAAFVAVLVWSIWHLRLTPLIDPADLGLVLALAGGWLYLATSLVFLPRWSRRSPRRSA